MALLVRQYRAPSTSAKPLTPTATVQPNPDLGGLIKQARPAVVTIIVYDGRGRELGFGSGFFISRTGEILTNHHVIEGASSAKARTSDGAMHPVQVILADDPKSDLARLLVFSDQDTPYLPVAADRPQVGDQVVVVGSPMGLDETVTEGIVSAVPEQRAGQSDLEPATLQITAAISEGSSGGPVLNARGEVVGVATAFMREGENLNFAVPLERILTLDHGRPRTFAEWRHPRRPVDANDYYVDGIASWRLADCDTGLDLFKKALDKNPRFAEAWWGRGLCFLDDGKRNDALVAFDRAVKLRPDFANAHYDLGMVYADEGRRDLASREYGVLKTLSPDLARKLEDYLSNDEPRPLSARGSSKH
ncbi:MAG TPA: trypsin-like peptidase domain-containing protein [Candidatus Binataceae bacterium]|nr:trypsin-like peptidase domain-containing protein [Candidatus Binataceae bacterium]